MWKLDVSNKLWMWDESKNLEKKTTNHLWDDIENVEELGIIEKKTYESKCQIDYSQFNEIKHYVLQNCWQVIIF